MATPSQTHDTAQDAIVHEDLEKLRYALEQSPLHRQLGIEFLDFQAGRISARLPGSPLLRNFLGFAHTGALFSLAEETMAAAANSIGYLGLPLSCEIHFLHGADPSLPVLARAHVVDTQGRIARVQVELTQGEQAVARLTEMVFLRSGARD